MSTTEAYALPLAEKQPARAEKPTRVRGGQKTPTAADGERVQHISNPCFKKPETEERLFGDGSPKIEVPIWSPSSDPARGVRLAKKLTLTGQQETTMFLRYNYARYRLSQLLNGSNHRNSAKLAAQIAVWTARSAKARATLVRANLALVYAMVKCTRVGGVELAELVSAGNMALLRSVDNFDVSRGARFSTYACRSILKSFSRLARQAQRQQRHLQMRFSPNLEFLDLETEKEDKRWQESVETLREILEKNQARLTELEMTIVNERFAIGRGGKGRTLAEIARIVGLTNERVRQLQIIALSKIRAALDRQLTPSNGRR